MRNATLPLGFKDVEVWLEVDRSQGRGSLSGPFRTRRQVFQPSREANALPLMMPSATRATSVPFDIPVGFVKGATQLRTVSHKGALLLGHGVRLEEMLRKAPSTIVLCSLEEWLGQYPDRAESLHCNTPCYE